MMAARAFLFLVALLVAPSCGETTSDAPGTKPFTAIQIAQGHIEAVVELTVDNVFPDAPTSPAPDNGTFFDCPQREGADGLVQSRYEVGVELPGDPGLDKVISNLTAFWEGEGFEVAVRESDPPSVTAADDEYDFDFVVTNDARASITGTTPCLKP